MMRRGLGASTVGAVSAGAGVSARAVLRGALRRRGGVRVRAVLRGASAEGLAGAVVPSAGSVPVAVSAGGVSARGVLVREGVFRAAPRPRRVLDVPLRAGAGVSSGRSAEVSGGVGVVV